MTCWWSQCHWWCKVLFEECPSLGGHYDIEWYWYWCLLRYWHCIGGGTIRHHWPEANTSIARTGRSRRLWMRIRVINLNKVAAGLEDCRHNPHIPRSAGGRRWIKIFPLRPINWINLKTYGIFHIYLSLNDKIQWGKIFGQKCPFKSYLGAKTWAIALGI